MTLFLWRAATEYARVKHGLALLTSASQAFEKGDTENRLGTISWHHHNYMS